MTSTFDRLTDHQKDLLATQQRIVGKIYRLFGETTGYPNRAALRRLNHAYDATVDALLAELGEHASVGLICADTATVYQNAYKSDHGISPSLTSYRKALDYLNARRDEQEGLA